MGKELLKTAKGKWAVALLVLAVLGVVSACADGDARRLLGSLIVTVVAIGLAVSAANDIENPPPPPSPEEMGIFVIWEELDAFEKNGTLPNVKNCPVILGAGERAVYACRADRVETKHRKVGTTGGGAGVSFRVAKGVRVRTGGAGSQSVYGDIEVVHSGDFIVTTKRIVFLTISGAFEEKLSDLSALTVDDDCLVIMTAKNNYAMRMTLPEYPCNIIKHCIKTL